jgi:hypothetical protein
MSLIQNVCALRFFFALGPADADAAPAVDAREAAVAVAAAEALTVLRLRLLKRVAEPTTRRQSLLIRGEQLQQLELLHRGERRCVFDRPYRRRRPTTRAKEAKCAC